MGHAYGYDKEAQSVFWARTTRRRMSKLNLGLFKGSEAHTMRQAKVPVDSRFAPAK